jgi:hypothetical protein
VRRLVKPVGRDNRADADGFEQDVVTRIARHFDELSSRWN